MLKTAFISLVSAIGALVFVAGALAAANPSGSGQPGASCEDSTVRPPGFSSPGFANAETHYAGSEDTPSLNAHSTQAVSQYDVACFQLTSH